MRTSGYHSCMKCITRLSTQQPGLRTNASKKLLTNKYSCRTIAPLLYTHQFRWKSGNNLSSIVTPVPLVPDNSVGDNNVGEELSTKINKDDILKIVNKFSEEPEVNILAAENGLDSTLFEKAIVSFRNFCIESKCLPPALHILLSDILQGAGHVTDILPYFLHYARQTFPHLDCIEELKKISDLQQPADWYPDAREMKRKLVFHAGPTNSGKTYRALERFMTSKSGVYCGPLKLLSVEVFNKTNEKGTPCDLFTGEERRMVLPDNTPANHVACTIEMVSLKNNYEVAVIDEIQMIKDPVRGWAWTRALLGLCADEIHICGEAAAIDLVKKIAMSCGEEVEVRKYKRLTDLTIENNALMDYNKIRPGDCIVCFNKNDIFTVSLELEKRGYECAVIYGGLPPGTKLAQAKKFNDPDHPCKILVATDAIGMGLNLSIRRIIFYSLMKPVTKKKQVKAMDTISTSQALQIGGRAGRFNTQFSEGFVTTFRNEDLPILKTIMSKDVEKIERAGLCFLDVHLEECGYNLPQETLSTNVDILKSVSQLNSSMYFLCDTEIFQFLADKIQHILLPSRDRYVFCCAPINIRHSYISSKFTQFARQCSLNEPLTCTSLCKTIGWPFPPPQNLRDLKQQEAVFDVLDLYLWLSYRFPDIFPDVEAVRKIQRQLDENIQQGVFNITHLLRAGKAADDVEDHVDCKTSNLKSSPDVVDDMDPDYMMRSGKNIKKFGKGGLTQELLNQGLLTPEMLKTLQKEWKQSLNENRIPFNPLKSKKYSSPPRRYKRRNNTELHKRSF